MAELEITQSILDGVVADRTARAAKGNDPRALPLEKRKAFAYGNQAGAQLEYWPGLKPADGADPKEVDEFKRRIVIADALSGVLGTYTSHIIGNDPEWMLTAPDSGEELPTDSDEVKALTLWHKQSELHARLKKADYDMRWGETSYLRLLIPEVFHELYPEMLTQGGKDLPTALRLAHLQALDATEAGCYRDASGVPLAYWVAYSKPIEGKPVTHIEVHTRTAVAVYTEDNGKLKLAPAAEGLTNPYPNPVADPEDPLTFHCLMHEVRRGEGAQINFSDIDLQGSVSVSASNIRKNNDLAGHRQYYTVNAAPPIDQETGERIAYQFGPKRVLDIQADYVTGADGQPVVGSDGKPSLTPVNVGTFDPVDSDGMRQDAEFFKRELYDRHDLLWKLAEGNVSGESRRESRAAFDRALPDEAQPIQAALEWAIGTAYRYGQFIMGNQNPESLNVTGRLFLRISPVDLETWKTALQAHAAGQLDDLTLGEINPFGVDAKTYTERIQAARWRNLPLANAARTAGLPEAAYLRWVQNALQLDTPPEGLVEIVTAEDVTNAQEMASLGLEAGAGADNGTGTDLQNV